VREEKPIPKTDGLTLTFVWLEYSAINKPRNPRSVVFQVREAQVKQSTGHTHTGHTDRENTPDTGKPLARTQSESEKRHTDA